MLIIDTREGKLIELIKKTPSMNIPYEIKNLQIGDIIISSSKFPEKSLYLLKNLAKICFDMLVILYIYISIHKLI